MLKHWIWLTRRPGIGTRACDKLLRMWGSAEKIYAMKEADYLSREEFDRRWLPGLLDKDTKEARKIVLDCDTLGIRILTRGDSAYPQRLENIPDPPAVLYYKGTLPAFDEEAAIAVVGSRNCTAYGLMHAKRFGRQIPACGGMIVTGGARGIDTMALYGAIEGESPVAVVLGCGVDIVYPRENKQLFREVLSRGCLLSEYPPGTQPLGSNFPVRNRIISGLTLGTLVVEAPERSGALITASLALEQGRDVFAIPGNIGVKQCEGSNRLLREGATLVENGWDILREYAYIFPRKLTDGRKRENMERATLARISRPPAACSPGILEEEDKKGVDNWDSRTYSDRTDSRPDLTEDETTVFRLLSGEPVHGDTLVALSGLPAQRVLTALTMLQIKQLVSKEAGNMYIRKK